MSDQTEKDILATLKEIAATMTAITREIQKASEYLRVIADAQQGTHPTPFSPQRRT